MFVGNTRSPLYNNMFTSSLLLLGPAEVEEPPGRNQSLYLIDRQFKPFGLLNTNRYPK